MSLAVQQQYLLFPTNLISCCMYCKGSFIRIPSGENTLPNPMNFPYTMPTNALLKSLFVDMSSYSSTRTATIYLLRNGVRINTGISATLSQGVDEVDRRSQTNIDIDDYQVLQGDGIGIYITADDTSGSQDYLFASIGFVPNAI